MDDRRKTDRRQQDRLLTDSEVAALAKVPVYTVKYWRLTGTLPFVKLGRHPRVLLSVFQKIFLGQSSNDPLELSGSIVKYQSLKTLGGQHG